MNCRAILALLAVMAATLATDLSKGEFGAARPGQAAPQSPQSPHPAESRRENAAKKAQPKRATYPFHGTLDSVDREKKTVTLRGKTRNRILLVTSATRFHKSGAKAKLEDGTPGQRVTGLARKNADGHEEAISVRFKEQVQR